MSRRRRDESGAVAVLAAMVAVVLLVSAALTVDLGMSWARRGQLQVQADQAALLAAESLPAVDAASRERAAAQAAYWICRNPVAGQRKLDPQMPTCGDATTAQSPAVVSYARRLLSAGLVSFPTPTEVKVLSPRARVDFGFGAAAGAAGTVQQKTAVARVSSPGDLEPMGLDLTCMISAAGNLRGPLGNLVSDVLPLNYIAADRVSTSGTSVTTTWPPVTTSGNPTIESITPASTTAGTGGTFTVTGRDWGLLNLGVLGAPLLGGDIRVYFKQGDAAAVEAQLTAATSTLLPNLGTATGVLPTAVVATPGTWQVKVQVRKAGTLKWSSAARTFTVTVPPSTTDLFSCARLLESPRRDVTGTTDRLVANLKEGLDHPLVAHPQLVSLNLPNPSISDVLNALGNTGGALSCSSSALDVKDVENPPSTPNCVLLAQGSHPRKSFTEGMIGSPSAGVPGRLACSTARPCPGRTVPASVLDSRFGSHALNDDVFDDFVIPERRNLLTDPVFFNVSSYVSTGVPLITPQSALKPELYSSHRFFWVPVLAKLPTNNSGNDASFYPVLTFRPVFVTQEHPSTNPVIGALEDFVRGLVRDLLGSSSKEAHGLVVQGGEVVAAKFMTIEPSALPEVPDDYTGPTSEYLGIGPKVIRLVQ